MAAGIRQELATFLQPLLQRLDAQIDARLVRTFLHTVDAIVRFRNRPHALLLSELGGYLLDPAYTPAKVLEFMLTSAAQEIGGAGQAQVIDLARTDLSPDGMDVIVDSLSLVRPDVVVVFIGNNLSKIKPPDEWRPVLADALQQGGFPSLQRVFRDEIMPLRCGESLDKLARTLGAECEVVVVVVLRSALDGSDQPGAPATGLAGVPRRWRSGLVGELQITSAPLPRRAPP